NKLGAFRPWTHEAHISLKYVEQLGKFVQACPSYEPADSGYPGIVFGRPGFFFLFVGLKHHGPELVHLEGLVVLADSDLCKYDGTFGSKLYQYGNYQHRD